MFKIIISDDEAIEIEYLKRVFQKHQDEFQILGTALNGEDVITLAESNHPDVIILDICMPGKNGLEAAEFLKKKFPEICIILNTAFAEFEFARKAIEIHLDAYLLKPASEEMIIETLRKCLRKKQENIKHTSKNQNLSYVINYIDSHYKNEITLKELANIAHFSPTYLSKKFHQELGCTLNSYINNKRIENAKLLLEKTEWYIQEIAVDCGFVNVSHFNKVFKNIVGKSPMEYKRESSN